MKSLLLRFILGIFAVGFVTTSGLAQTHSGAIKALKVSGIVTRVDSTGAEHAVTEGSMVSETDAIKTGADSGLVLVFMNGSSVKLGANSKLLVEEFKMDPLADNIAVSTLKKEPSVSQTKLNLAYGEMVGDVKKLNKSSSYNIKTPVGAAGIRGTQFRIVFFPPAAGSTVATFQLSTSEGLVLFTGTTGAPVEVAKGNEVNVTAEVNTTTGAVTSANVVAGGISTAASAAITTAVTDAIAQAQSAGAFTPAEQSSAGSGSSGGSSGTPPGGEAAGGETKTENTTPDIPASTPPQPSIPSIISPSS